MENILGKFFTWYTCVQTIKRVIKIMTGQDLETLAESYLKLEDFNFDTYFPSSYL